MAKSTKVFTSTVAKVNGFEYLTVTGHRVVSGLNSSRLAEGDAINYAEIQSLKTVRFQAGRTQWTENKAIGASFFKQV